MKGRNIFTQSEITELERLIVLRNKTISSGQKTIRDKMRKLGFFGKDDWKITDMKLEDLRSLIKSGRLKISDSANIPTTKQEPNKITLEKPQHNKIKTSELTNDEQYVLNICDKVLGLTSSRQHKFDYLQGDPNSKGTSARLPVDSYYDELKLVIEYREKQHTESVSFFDKPNRITVSGVHRGEQRRIYDERRRQVLPKNNISLVEISYSDFNHDRQKRIIRNINHDNEIIKQILKDFVKKK
jgi:hypothetical protein